MNKKIRANRIRLRIGSYEWMNFFGFPTALIFFAFLPIFQLKDILENGGIEKGKYLYPTILIIGICTYILQYLRLRFTTIKITSNIEDLKEDILEILQKHQWDVDYNNGLFLQATYRKSLFSLDMLTFKIRKNKLQWNLIYNPGGNNSISALLTLNLKGRIIIKEIKQICQQYDNNKEINASG